MRKLAILLLLLLPAAVFAQDLFDMTTYYMVILKHGPNKSATKEETQKLAQGHMAGMRKNFADGKLVVAGPFADKSDLAGIFIFRVSSMEEAKALCDQDPMVKAGVLVAEIHPWSAAKNLTVTK